MDFQLIFALAVSVIILVQGILTLKEKYLPGNMEQYTQASIHKYAKGFGVVSIITGILFIVASVMGILRRAQPSDTLLLVEWILYLVGLVLFIVGLIVSRKKLQKK